LDLQKVKLLAMDEEKLEFEEKGTAFQCWKSKEKGCGLQGIACHYRRESRSGRSLMGCRNAGSSVKIYIKASQRILKNR
jgi:hypothetical protein